MILAIESSCDESAVAVFDPAKGIVAEWLNSQIEVHGRHGGVVPDLAAREHLQHLGPLIEHSKPWWKHIDQVAVTYGPGLAPCLALGVASAKALAATWKVPVAGVNHLRGHVWSPFIRIHAENPERFTEQFETLLPHLALIVSGGHTLLCTVDKERTVKILSSTRDDAAGEALDKGAKLLGLGYPGGPLVEQHAKTGNPEAYAFPRGIVRKDDLDFSFSGLKTSLRYLIEKLPVAEVEGRMADLCASYQEAVVSSLVKKTGAALGRGGFRSVGLSGGVANNVRLRAALLAEANSKRVSFLAAESKHTGDNAGMIAFAAWVDPKGILSAGAGLGIDPSLSL